MLNKERFKTSPSMVLSPSCILILVPALIGYSKKSITADVILESTDHDAKRAIPATAKKLVI